MKWFTDIIGLTTAEDNYPNQQETTQEPSRLQYRTTLLAKVKGTNKDIEGNDNNKITSEEIQSLKNAGGNLNEIINIKTNETLLDRAIKLNNIQAIEALKKEGAVTNRARMNEVIKDIPNKDKQTISEIQTNPAKIIIEQTSAIAKESDPRERSDSGYTTEESDNSINSPITIPNEQELKTNTSPEVWNKSSSNAAEIADTARSTKIENIEAGKNKAIVKPKEIGAEIAARMEDKLKARQESSKSKISGKLDFRTMKKVEKGNGARGR